MNVATIVAPPGNAVGVGVGIGDGVGVGTVIMAPVVNKAKM
jgi:hypothetical protein